MAMTLPSLSTLSPEQIQILCAEAAGYSFDGMTPPFLYGYINGEAKQFPAYHCSLDAVAELEAGPKGAERNNFAWNLRQVMSIGREIKVGWPTAISASALQRASAYLLTKRLVTL